MAIADCLGLISKDEKGSSETYHHNLISHVGDEKVKEKKRVRMSLDWSAKGLKLRRRVVLFNLLHRQVFEFTHISSGYQSGGEIPSVEDLNRNVMRSPLGSLIPRPSSIALYSNPTLNPSNQPSNHKKMM